MQPLQDDFRVSAAKDNSMRHAAAAGIINAATPPRSAEIELHSTLQPRAKPTEIAD